MKRPKWALVACSAIVIAGISFLLFSQASQWSFGSDVPLIVRDSVTLHSGVVSAGASSCSTSGNSSYFLIVLYNPDPNTSVSNVILTSNSGQAPSSAYYLDSNNNCVQISIQNQPLVSHGGTTTLTIFFSRSSSFLIQPNQVFNYDIAFSNGQSLSGSVIAQ